MIVNALVLGIIVFFGFLILFRKAPKMLQRFCVKHQFISDVVLTMMGYQLMSMAGAVTSLLGAAILAHGHRPSRLASQWTLGSIVAPTQSARLGPLPCVIDPANMDLARSRRARVRHWRT